MRLWDGATGCLSGTLDVEPDWCLLHTVGHAQLERCGVGTFTELNGTQNK